MKTHQIKKYSKAFLLSMVLGSMFVSCNSFIDDLEPIAQDSDNYFNSEEDYNKALIGAYEVANNPHIFLTRSIQYI